MIEKIKNKNLSNFNLEQNIINQLINKYGKEKQIGQVIEEMAELIVELNKNINRNKENRQEILEEYTDVSFMLKQLVLIYGFTNDEIQSCMENKMSKAARNL